MKANCRQSVKAFEGRKWSTNDKSWRVKVCSPAYWLPEEVPYHPLLSRTFEAVIDGRVIAGLRRSKGSGVAMR